MLAVSYFHPVFTLPHDLNDLIGDSVNSTMTYTSTPISDASTGIGVAQANIDTPCLTYTRIKRTVADPLFRAA